MLIPKGLIETTHTDDIGRPVYTGESGVLYTGYAHRLSTGELFTGSEPSIQSKPLYFFSKTGQKISSGKEYNKINKGKTAEESENNITTYVSANENNIAYMRTLRVNKNSPHAKAYQNSSIIIPKKVNNQSSAINYLAGNYIRFIVHSLRDNKFYFTNANAYKYYKENFRDNFHKIKTIYCIAPLRWFIRAKSVNDVNDINYFNIDKLNKLKEFKGIHDFFDDYDEFYADKNTHHLTVGNELIYSNGSNYVGYYNIDELTNEIFEGKIYSRDSRELFMKNKFNELST
jgi:hypothetical protein